MQAELPFEEALVEPRVVGDEQRVAGEVKKRPSTVKIDGAPRSSWSRSPVRRATGSGSATRGFTSDWNESTSSSP